MALGFNPDARYEESTVTLERGDMIVMYTDGLVEALSKEPGIAGSAFTNLLLESRKRPDFHAAVIEGVKGLAGRRGFDDDVALLSIEMK
jgi:sigma-B regulation protein RsbU (phosphoserine phosphatase)